MPAVEVLVATAFIRDCIIDKEKTHLINSAIAQGTSQYGMQTFDQSIFGLFQQGFISLEEALRWASNVDEFKLKVQGISTTGDAARDEMASTVTSGAGAPKFQASRGSADKIGAVNKPRPPADPDSSKAAYFRALRWLTARELSEGQVRARLAEKGYTANAIKPAVERLLNDRTIDDRRAATAVARTEARVRRHGPHRVMGKLIAMQIDRDLAKDVVRELFGEEPEEALLEQDARDPPPRQPRTPQGSSRAAEDPRLPRPSGLLRLGGVGGHPQQVEALVFRRSCLSFNAETRATHRPRAFGAP